MRRSVGSANTTGTASRVGGRPFLLFKIFFCGILAAAGCRLASFVLASPHAVHLLSPCLCPSMAWTWSSSTRFTQLFYRLCYLWREKESFPATAAFTPCSTTLPAELTSKFAVRSSLNADFIPHSLTRLSFATGLFRGHPCFEIGEIQLPPTHSLKS